MTLRDLRWLVTGLVLGLFFVVTVGKGSAYSLKLTARVDSQVRATNSCRPYLGVARYPVRRTYARQSVKFRLWALKLWTRRARRCHAQLQALVPHRAQWLCIYSHEKGSDGWQTNTSNGYFGGLQMNLGFQRTYGPEFLRRKGTANNWTPFEQMLVAERAHRGYAGHGARGFGPWPNTARYCGLL